MKLKALLSVLLICFCHPISVPAAELSVFAASSLTEALRQAARHYELQYPGDRVLLNFAGSQTLAMQIENGAPVDLFISASQTVMKRLDQTQLVFDVHPWIGNRLVLAFRADLPQPITDIVDLARPGLLLIIGNDQVPVGRYTRQLFDAMSAEPRYGSNLVSRIRQNIVSEENRVKAIVAKLLLGEADAGIVYQSDIHNDKLIAIPLPEKLNPIAVYPMAKIKGGNSQSDRLYNFLQTNDATEIFHSYGFLTGIQL